MTVPRFLNRISGLPLLYQNIMFDIFLNLLEQNIKFAKQTGEYEFNVHSFMDQKIRLQQPCERLFHNPVSGGQVYIYPITRDRGMDLVEAIHELNWRVLAATSTNRSCCGASLLFQARAQNNVGELESSATSIYPNRACRNLAMAKVVGALLPLETFLRVQSATHSPGHSCFTRFQRKN